MQPWRKGPVGLVDGKLITRQQCALVAKAASPTVGCIRHGTAKRWEEVIVPLYSTLVQLHLE